MNKHKNILPFLVISGFIAIACGFIGWTSVLITLRGESTALLAFMEAVPRTLLYFVGEGFKDTYYPCLINPKDGCLISDFKSYSLIFLKISQFLSLLCSFGVVLWGIVSLSHKGITRWRISRLKNHIVVIGFSDIAKSIIISESKKRKIDIVIIDNEYSLANEAFSSLRSNVFYMWGDFSDSEVLTLASVTKAESIIVITEQDSCNLRTVSHIRSLMSDIKTRKEPTKAYIKVDCHVFWREITQSALFKRMENGIEVIPFNLPVIAARHFIWHCPLFVYADLQNQSRVHSVFIGFNEYAESLFEKLLSSCIYKTLEIPYFTILVSNKSDVEKHIISKYPGLDLKSIIHFVEYKTERDCLNSSLIKKIKNIAPITAIFIFCENSDIALCHTINIRNEVTRCTLSSPPIFIQMSHVRGVQNLIAMSPDIKNFLGAKKFEDILAPYGMHNDICQLDSIDGSFRNSIEDYACELHECHENLNDQQISSDKNTSKESLKSWSRLDETFREANRRAIDHIPAKLMTAGCFVLPGFSLNVVDSFQLTKSSEEIEILSELEQKSWSLGKYINGWKPGDKRNNRQKKHELLGKKYSELDEITKGYDRAQINLINSTFLKKNVKKEMVTVWHDYWIGLIGHNRIDGDEIQYIKSIFSQKIIKNLCKKDVHAFITLVTPLAFGSDLLLTELTLDYLCEKEIPHRLLIIEAVPFDYVLKDYINTSDTDGLKIKELEKTRNTILNHTSTDWVVSLIDEEKDYTDQSVREQGYEEAATYINTRCHTLVAVHRTGSTNLTGGTTATLIKRPLAIQENNLLWKMNFLNSTIEIDPQSKSFKESEIIEKSKADF